MRIDTKQFWQAIGLLIIGIIINTIPFFYEYMDAITNDTSNSIKLLPWITMNSEFYFLLLSTLFMSFMEYIIGTDSKKNFLILINIGCFVIEFALWGIWSLREDIAWMIFNNFPIKYFFYSLIGITLIFCLINIFVMSFSSEKDKVKEDIRQKVY